MKINPRSVVLLLAAVVICAGIGVIWSRLNSPPPELNAYRSWTIANEEIVAMDPSVAALCIAFPQTTKTMVPRFQGKSGPHDKKWLRVYVNAAGKEALLTQKFPKYPIGTVIVKEKLPTIIQTAAGSSSPIETVGTTPELLTVMIKREANYDKGNGDWEYMVTDGEGKKVTERGKLPSCQGCHKPYEKTDYVVRTYLPDSVKKALKDLDDAKS